MGACELHLKRPVITQSPLYLLFHNPDMTEIPLKGT